MIRITVAFTTCQDAQLTSVISLRVSGGKIMISYNRENQGKTKSFLWSPRYVAELEFEPKSIRLLFSKWYGLPQARSAPQDWDQRQGYRVREPERGLGPKQVPRGPRASAVSVR